MMFVQMLSLGFNDFGDGCSCVLVNMFNQFWRTFSADEKMGLDEKFNT